MQEFHKRVAVITGAASGLGLALAEHAATLGMRLVLTDIDGPRLDAAAARLARSGVDTLAMACDVSRPEAVAALADRTHRTHGAAHLLFNNAGVGGGNGFVWESSLADWQWSLGVNLWGVIHGLHSFVPAMVAAAQRDPGYQGHVVNTASMAGFFNPPITGAYNAGKHAVTAISETLHHDLALAGVQIRCSVLAPFFVATGIAESERHRPAHLSLGASTASQRLQQAQARAGMERAGSSAGPTAADVAQLTFEGIRAQRFYIFPHPGMLRSVEQRMQAILAQADPADPFAFRPGVFQDLRAQLALRAGATANGAQS